MYDKEVSFMFIHRSNDQSASFPKQLCIRGREILKIFLLNLEGKQVGPVRDKVISEGEIRKRGWGNTKTLLLGSSGGNTSRFQVSVPTPLPYA